MGKLNHSKLNLMKKARKSSQDVSAKSRSKLRIKKDLATDAQKRYMKHLGISFTDNVTLRQAMELIRNKKKEQKDATIPTIGIN